MRKGGASRAMRKRRLAWKLAVAALALAPVAHAQVEVGGGIDVAIDPIARPIEPLAETLAAPFRVTVACPLASEAPGAGSAIDVTLAELPTWAQATVSPATFVIEDALASCPAGESRTFEGTLYVAAAATAPAFEPATGRLVARLRDATGPREGEATFEVQAGYRSVLDLRVAEPIQEARAGTTVAFRGEAGNLANAPSRVAFLLEATTQPRWSIRLPDPLVIGAEEIATFDVLVTAAPDGALQNEPGQITIRARAEHAGDPAAEGDEATLSILLTATGAAVAGARDLPLAPTLPLLALALAALASRALQAPRPR